MKKIFASKISALIASLMIVSALVPVLAFANSFEGVPTSLSGTTNVTGQVYVTDSVYTTGKTIPVYVYGEDNKTVVDVVYATYASNGRYDIDFDVPSVTYSTYYYLNYHNVTQAVYYNPYYGGGGFPGFPSGGVIDGNGNVDGTQLTNLFATDKNPTITSTSDVVTIPADALIKGETLTIKLEDGTSITLPIAALKLEEKAKSLGIELSALDIKVELKKLTGDAAKAVSDAVYGIDAKPLATPVDFKIIAVGGGKEEQYTKLDVYFKRTLPVIGSVDSDKVTGVVYNPDTKELSFVPATFATEGDKTIATLLRNSTSIYTVIQLDNVSFADLANHWAKEDIETLAAKLVVEGTGANKFEPKRNITRAEFAALIVRSLGLDATGTTSKFSDVSSSQWYAGVVATAAEAGIVQGDDKGKFNPNANITRKELSAMVVRALGYAGKEVTLTDAEASAALAAFTDASSLGWAKAEVAAAVKSGIVLGQTTTKVVGDASASRAEAATMVIRLLGNAGFINN
ncbi:S-layer homology domain-containing protein [Paenibacillus sepulcri]|uniref:S-layer homology domain-containing protein n=1 Tax=Paenibacillus sepulcri TaxID=359917 RepID=A0ABS7BVM6_9BACL|nr:S-layer homology domain-containing protein [Paenibacillus sepulcri]